MTTPEESTFYRPRILEEGAGHRFVLPASAAACVGSTGRRLVMGGVSFGAVLDAMERSTGRGLLWATAQFVSPAFAETDFVIDVDEVVSGRRLTQAGARLMDEDRVVLEVRAALGETPDAASVVFPAMPDVPRPEDCPSKSVEEGAGGEDLFGQFERRLAAEDDELGTEHLWFRPVSDAPLCTALLAVYADHVAGAHRLTRGSTSLDCTLRGVATRPSRWVLASTAVTALGPTTFHASMNLFAEDGTLLAVASQTGVLPRSSRSQLQETRE